MRFRPLLPLAVLLSLTAGAVDKSPFAGVWEGTANDLPGVEITIHDSGRLDGTVVFFFQTRASASDKWRVDSRTTVPMLALKVDGSALTFETIHHKTHGSTEFGPNVRFRLDLTAANEAVFRRLEEDSDLGAGWKLTRRTPTPAK